MELDDLKSAWNNEDNQVQKQYFTSKIIDQMTQKKYNSKIKKIAYPEMAGSLICIIASIYIGANFNKLDTAFLQATGVLSILLLMIISVIGLASLRRLTMTKDVYKPHAETLKIFATQKMLFYKLQKINVTLCYLLLVTIIILLSKFFSGKDITDSKYFWTFSFTVGYLFLLFYSRFVSKFYKKTLKQSEELLQELQP